MLGSRVRASDNPPDYYAVCPGGEGAVLKTVGLKGLAGSNPVHGAIYGVIGEVINTLDCGSSMRRFDSYMAPQLVNQGGSYE